MKRMALLLVGVLLGGMLPALAPLRGYRFEMPDSSNLLLRAPSGWKVVVEPKSDRNAPRIVLTPVGGAPFRVTVTPVWRAAGEPAPTATEIREWVLRAAGSLLPQAEEKRFTLQEMRGAEGGGFYFQLTDRAPAAGGYRYIHEGILRTGGLLLFFTILTNVGQERFAAQALAMLRDARHMPPAPKPPPRRQTPRAGG